METILQHLIPPENPSVYLTLRFFRFGKAFPAFMQICQRVQTFY